MKANPARPRSMRRLLAIYAAISLVPVLILGVVLADTLRGDAIGGDSPKGRPEARY